MFGNFPTLIMAAAEFTLKFCYLKPIYQKFTMVCFEKNSTCWEQVYFTGTKVINQLFADDQKSIVKNLKISYKIYFMRLKYWNWIPSTNVKNILHYIA